MGNVAQQLNITYPIIQGGMGNVSHAALTAAISEAGGLGTIGAGTFTVTELEDRMKATEARTTKPYAVNIPINVQPHLQDVIELVLQSDVPIVSLSAGNPAPFIKPLQDEGKKVICVVSSVKQAKKAEAAGADLLVAEGFEAAGINAAHESTTLTLIPQVVDAVSIPVIAAGGIGDGRGLAAVLALGASGVQMGTRFIVTKEAQVHDAYKHLIQETGDTDTRIVGRSVGRVRRLLNTPYTKALQEKEREGLSLEAFNQLTDEAHHINGAIYGKLEDGHVNGGQIAGLIKDVPTVETLIHQMMHLAKDTIGTLNSSQMLFNPNISEHSV